MTDTDYRRVDDVVDELFARHPPQSTEPEEFWGAQYDLGLAWVWHEEGFGGLGLSRKDQPHINWRIEEAGGSTENRLRNLLGIAMGAGVLTTHGTDAQKQRWLRPMFTNQEIWCQMFSEPGAGSDLAGLSMRAEPDGDEWVVNGQKVFISRVKQSDLMDHFGPRLQVGHVGHPHRSRISQTSRADLLRC